MLTGKTLDASFVNDETLSCETHSFESISPETEKKAEGDRHSSVVEKSSYPTTTTTANASDNLYRRYYFRNPCVPVDFASINEALQHCPRTRCSTISSMRPLGDEETFFYSNTGTVVLFPGVYDGRINISGEIWSADQRTHDKGVTIRAAFPQLGATIRSRQSEDNDAAIKDEPCISISTCDDDTLEGVQKGISVLLSHLQILHSTPGVSTNSNTMSCVLLAMLRILFSSLARLANFIYSYMSVGQHLEWKYSNQG